jgi:hypothetical protein
MGRRLNRDGQAVLAQWLDHYQPDKDTRRLIGEAIEAYAGDPAQLRFHMMADESNPGVTVIEPEAGLTVHVRPLGPAEFTLARIIDGRDWDGG